MVARIYDVAGQPMTDACAKAMDEFMADHPAGATAPSRTTLAEFGSTRTSAGKPCRHTPDRFGV